MAIYLKYDGIDGDVTETGHTKWIEILDVEWSGKRTFDTGVGSANRRESSLPEVTTMSLTKFVDTATPKFLVGALSQTEGKKATIDFVLSGSGGQKYLELTLEKAILASYTLAAAADTNTRAKEIISLSFTKIEVKYTPFDDAGKAGSPIAANYDIATSKAG